jgi:CheY-like chemotaxis protein
MKKLLIVIAEDDMDDRFLLQQAFAESGNDETLEFVDNGLDLMSYLNCKAKNGVYPDLIVLDLNMPKMSGKEVLAEIKRRPMFDKIPVIIYTTTQNELEIEKCYALGADKYIVKPANFDDLRDVVLALRSCCVPAPAR